ncbi:CitMHS family transporter [Shimwellia blattae]|uniref:Citrate transporter n=1 Tax=Shimwellia blattae (strain ATCC 29907 / DSM 4481 / JCM 1650 / NBRC 105725 / CDC 9005-74) TaxID=630626 RepID=I2BEN4_SHIBC|nr:citrate:proton symporter [Shimwellia blattae]AFJ48988.1 citrate transporter [Shimwellia blattae DSM 4481 = NBRC 105725]GAB82312.1 putative citrate transporter [Shimwellia blattae DSM 4481 = NBRC 105725]VDY66473.1 Citrate transporter [Shimwellia blattae]VEC28384.1 Citrate transporter [Shimwellia blattae]
MLSIIAVVTVLLCVILLMSGRMSPVVTLILLPVIAALVAGFSPSDIHGFIRQGILTLAPVVVLFICAILYFSIMSAQGLFTPAVNLLLRFAGNSPAKVMMSNVLITALAHLDGAGATTYLITVTAFLPVYRRLGISLKYLMLLTGCSAGIMNLLPWTAPVLRAASVVQMDPVQLWKPLWPVQIFGLVCCLGVAWLLGRRYRGLPVVAPESEPRAAPARHVVRWRYGCNALLTLVMVILLVASGLPGQLIFMVALALALAINYPDAKTQLESVRQHAGEALLLATVLFSAAVFLGILTGSGMLAQVTEQAIALLPALLSRYLYLLLGFFALPLGMMFGADPWYFGILPVVSAIGEAHGIDPAFVARAMMLGENVGFSVSPMVGSAWLLASLAGVDLGQHIRYALLTIWAIALLMLGMAVLTGAIGLP